MCVLGTKFFSNVNQSGRNGSWGPGGPPCRKNFHQAWAMLGPYGVPIHVFSRVFEHFSGFSKNFATPKSKISVDFSLCDMVKKNFFLAEKIIIFLFRILPTICVHSNISVPNIIILPGTCKIGCKVAENIEPIFPTSL